MTFRTFNPLRLKRVLDIIHDQSRSLRVRTFMNYLEGNAEKGSYIYIGEPPSSDDKCLLREFSSTCPTDLKKIKSDDFNVLSSHGYNLAKKTYVVN